MTHRLATLGFGVGDHTWDHVDLSTLPLSGYQGEVDRTISLTFMLGGLLAGAAGMIYALYNGTIQFNQGFTAGLIAFTAAVMGGIGNLKGAVVGGLIIGVIQSISDTHFGQVWTPAVVFAILILVMVFRPQGLFGEETREG